MPSLARATGVGRRRYLQGSTTRRRPRPWQQTWAVGAHLQGSPSGGCAVAHCPPSPVRDAFLPPDGTVVHRTAPPGANGSTPNASCG
jgi:hypothetical protein